MAGERIRGDGTLPTYIQCVSDIYVHIKDYVQTIDTNVLQYPYTFYRDCLKHCSVEREDIAIALGLALFWTALRYVLSWTVFLPLARYVKLTPLNTAKFPESAFKTLFYGSTWMYSFYLLIGSGKYDYFYSPLRIWEDWQPFMSIPGDIRVLYLIQFSFYLHSVYGTLYMDHWRKDSLVMVFHHFLTMALIGFSYASRYHKIGLLVLFQMDIADICLEFTKCNVYFKNRDEKYYPIHDHISTVGFLGFASTWFVFRLYWFPLKVLYSTAVGVVHYGPATIVPFYFFFNVLLWVLQTLNIYWFMFIINFLYKVATGQMKEVDDLRETEVEEMIKTPKQEKIAVNTRQNGTAHCKPQNGSAAHVHNGMHNGDKYTAINRQANGYVTNGYPSDHEREKQE